MMKPLIQGHPTSPIVEVGLDARFSELRARFMLFSFPLVLT